MPQGSKKEGEVDIISLPIEFDNDRIDSRFRLVVIASQRARELALGAPLRLQEADKASKEHRVTTAALLEAIGNKIDFLKGQKAVEARERAEKIDFKKLADERRKGPEDLSELEKDLKVYLHERESDSRRDFEDVFGDLDDIDDSEE